MRWRHTYENRDLEASRAGVELRRRAVPADTVATLRGAGVCVDLRKDRRREQCHSGEVAPNDDSNVVVAKIDLNWSGAANHSNR
jgi:hypothetical protein